MRTGRANQRAAGLGRRNIKETTLILAASVFAAVAYNATFLREVSDVYPVEHGYLGFDASLFVLLVAINAVVISLLGSRYTSKGVIVVLQLASSVSSYFMSEYGVLVDDGMLRNVVETNAAEAFGFFSLPLVLHVLFLGVLPSWLVVRIRVEYAPSWRGLLRRSAVVLASVSISAALLFGSAPTFASFFREHKPMRFLCNPATYLVATWHLVHLRSDSDEPLRRVASDAYRVEDGGRRLVLFVVGETARADRFALNGYARETNPLLRDEDVISFHDVTASGTSTATALPLMFSPLGRKDANADQARCTENLLDVLDHVGVCVLWRDNNSSSKGVADRVQYQSFKKPSQNPVCDLEPRDAGMLSDLQDYIDGCEGDVFVVLHQMGSHGPAYWKRYPKRFEVFTPACESNLLETCSRQEIDNAYDNTILYTDYFLSQAIELLERNDEAFETALLYFGDHGESLGEHGMYLHGYPFALAPVEQTKVPAILWFGERFAVDRATLRGRIDRSYSHDNIFHTVLGIFGVRTDCYRDDLDMLVDVTEPGGGRATEVVGCSTNGAAAAADI